VAGKQTVGRAALVGVMSPTKVVGEKELVVTVEGAGLDEPILMPVTVSAMKPKLGDVISTSFEVRCARFGVQGLGFGFDQLRGEMCKV
jgi:hypothetical protein